MQRYRYQSFEAQWLQRLGAHQDWISVQAQGRLSQDGAPGMQGELAWVRSLNDAWLFTTELDAGASGGAGHVQASAEARRRFHIGANWTTQPFLATHLGNWSDAPLVRVDPLAWSYYDRDHFFGVGLGNWLDWRPLRDGRLRLGLQGQTTARLQPNWAQSGYIGRQFRITLGVEGQWLPTVGTLDSLVQIQLQHSPARGLRDLSPTQMPFHSAFDLPEDKR